MSFIKVEDVSKQLEEGLKNVFESQRFQELLKVMASQKDYSFNNMLMIAFQKPDATMIMGFKEWQKQGRFVEKGEKAIKILAPVIKNMEMEKIDPKTQKPQIDEKGNTVMAKVDVITGFRLVSVFDVSQTSGKELPSVRDFINRQLKDDDYMSTLYQNYKDFLQENSELDIREDITEKGVGGYFAPTTNEIVISTNTNTNDTEKFRVLIHEYAHSLLHGLDKEYRDVHRGHKEAQAESVAYVVSNYYGLDTSDISTGYIATWTQDIKLAKKAIEEIQKVANTIIDEIQLLQKDKIKQFENDDKYSMKEIKEFLHNTYGLSKDAFEDNSQETVFQLMNKENGIVMNGTLGCSKTGSYYIKTNRNIIEPLVELMPEGKLALLNIQKMQGINNVAYKILNEQYVVSKIAEQDKYVVLEKDSKIVASKEFETKDEAKSFKLRAAIGQSLINKDFIKKNVPEDLSKALGNINNTISQYISHHSKSEIQFNENGQEEKIAWALMKNPSIKTLDQLNSFVKDHQHVSAYKGIEISVKERENEMALSK